MKMCLAVALMVVATLTTTSFASPVQPITEAAGEEILPDLESINNEASIAQYPHDLEPIKNEASITQQNCHVDLNIPAFNLYNSSSSLFCDSYNLWTCEGESGNSGQRSCPSLSVG